MAKAKKIEAVAGKAPAKKKSGKKAVVSGGQGQSTQVPQVDTGLAAANAAKMLATRAKLHVKNQPSGEAKKESSTFKQLKDSLNRSAAHLVDSALGGPAQPIKTNAPLHGGNQSVHSQTQGGNASRASVPRRTAG